MKIREIHAENAIPAAKWLVDQGKEAFKPKSLEIRDEAISLLKRNLLYYLHPSSNSNHFSQAKTFIEQLEDDLLSLIACVQNVLPYLTLEAEHALNEIIRQVSCAADPEIS